MACFGYQIKDESIAQISYLRLIQIGKYLILMLQSFNLNRQLSKHFSSHLNAIQSFSNCFLLVCFHNFCLLIYIYNVYNFIRTMNKKDDPKLPDKPPRKYKFYLGSRQRYIQINCDFDSGNIQLIRQISQFQYRLASVNDGTNTQHKVNSKSWFYFCVTGFPKNTRGKFFVTKVQTLTSVFYSKYNKSYRPVYKSGDDGKWERLPTQCQLVMREDGQLQCVFEYLFKDESQKVYFAFCYPFTYADNKKYLGTLNDFLYIQDFYFHKEILIKSIEGRDIHLLTITSHDHIDPNHESETLFNQKLFPQKVRALRFLKPVVLISARVHPGESISSYAMKGLIDFLTNKNDLRAKLLRKMFVFMIVPMINVDGVYHGHFRMDTQGKNLNRYYIKPNPEKQPAIYAIKELATYLNAENRLSFYFDLHAHNSKKGHFIYGNAINDFVEQVESQVFCKIISMNNKGFEYEYCNFSEKHMNAKDRNEDLTKQGCGRVVMHKLAKIIHSYSVQCGIISPNKLNWLPDPENTDFKLEGKGLEQDPYQDNNNEAYKGKGDENAFFTPQMYENVGKNLMVSILDVFDKNPYNRVYNSKYKSMDMLRRLTAFEIFHEAERFRMFERFVFGKVKNINELIRQVLNTKLHYKKLYNFYFFDDKELKSVVWPQNIPGLSKPKVEVLNRIRKFKSIDTHSNDYSESFMRALKVAEENDPNVTQEEIQKAEENERQYSSQTEDFEANKDLQYEFLQVPVEVFSEKLIEDVPLRRELSFQPEKKHISLHQIQTKQRQETSTQLMLISGEEASKYANDKRKQNTSVRVRRLLRQDFTSGSFKSQKQLEENNKKKLDSEVSTTGAQLKKNIYESIKKQIKQQLRKEQMRERNLTAQLQNHPKIAAKTSEPMKIHKQRIKSWTVKRHQNSGSKNKIQLPSLGAQVYVISTSTKIMLKRN